MHTHILTWKSRQALPWVRVTHGVPAGCRLGTRWARRGLEERRVRGRHTAQVRGESAEAWGRGGE